MKIWIMEPAWWERQFKTDANIWDSLPHPDELQPQLLRAIIARDVASRRVAAALLGVAARKPTWKSALVRALTDKDAIVVSRALHALDDAPAEELAPHIARLATHHSAVVRVAACKATRGARGEVTDPRVLDALCACVDDRIAAVRAAAAAALGELRTEVTFVVPALTALLDDQSEPVRMAAARAVVAIGAPPKVLARLLRDKALRRSALAAFGPSDDDPHPPVSAIPAIRMALADRDHRTVQNALNALRGIGAAAAPAVRAVARLLTAKDAVNNSLAFDVLARIGPPSRIALPRLAAALRIENRAFAAAEVLATIGPEATTIAIAALDDPRERTRAAAVDALAPRLRDTPTSLAALLPVLADPAVEVRWRVVTALGELGTPEARAAIAQLRADPEEQIRRCVAYQLARVTARASDTAGGTTASRSPSGA